MPGLDADVVVVGGGIVGAATAWELARTGRDVVLVEQFELGHDRGSSHGATRVFRLSYPDPAWIRLAQEAALAWRALEAETGEDLLRITGSVDVGSYTTGNARALRECGVTTSLLGLSEAAHRWGLVLDPSEKALFQPDAGVLSAATALELFHSGVRDVARIVTATRVERLEVGNDSIVAVTSAGELTTRAAVVAAGAWAPRMLAPLGIDLAVTPTRETVAYLDVGRAEDLPVLMFERSGRAHDEGVGVYALADGPATLKVGVHHTGPVTDPDEPAGPEAWLADAALAWAARRLPDRPATLIALETCIYTNTADESFVIERHGRVVVASACSGHAFKFAPALGRTVAALAAEACA